MSQRMVHYMGGPADGHMELMQEDHHPFAASMSTDTDGYYGMDYRVVGQRIGDLVLTSEDVIAQWHQRTIDDFITGDVVILKATGTRAMVLGEATEIHDDGTRDEGLMVIIGTNRTVVAVGEIRIALPTELGQDDS